MQDWEVVQTEQLKKFMKSLESENDLNKIANAVHSVLMSRSFNNACQYMERKNLMVNDENIDRLLGIAENDYINKLQVVVKNLLFHAADFMGEDINKL